jgi:glycosyltransferase involved in cell wall biosynthesis
MLHIGIDARLTGYRVGGISTYTRRLIHALAQIDTHNRYTIFHSRRAGEPITADFDSTGLWTPPHHRFERLALSVELLRHRLDVLHSPDFVPPLRGARRHIITVHDLTFLHDPQHKDAAARRYYNDQITYAVRHADHILSVSTATKTDLMDLLNVPPDKITVQPHGVDPRFQPLSPESLAQHRAALDLPESFILFVGTLEPRKNIPALLDAYEQLPDAPPLVLAGQRGWLFDDTMTRIEAMQQRGLPIIHRADIDDDTLPALYNLAAVLVLPSFYEGFGLPTLEAMACGTPVIASNCSSLPEVVGDAGALIDPDDPAALASALAKALNDTNWRQSMRDAGLRRARNFTWQRSAEIALSVYESGA